MMLYHEQTKVMSSKLMERRNGMIAWHVYFVFMGRRDGYHPTTSETIWFSYLWSLDVALSVNIFSQVQVM